MHQVDFLHSAPPRFSRRCIQEFLRPAVNILRSGGGTLQGECFAMNLRETLNIMLLLFSWRGRHMIVVCAMKMEQFSLRHIAARTKSTIADHFTVSECDKNR